MANPYKKAEQVQKKAPGSRPVEPKVEVTPVVETPVVEVSAVVEEKMPVVEIAPAVTETPAAEAPATEMSIKNSLLADMKEQKPRGKSYGFYLDDEVVAALEKLAKQSKSNKSKVLNTLLRKVLIENN